MISKWQLVVFMITIFFVTGSAFANPVLSGVESGNVSVQQTDPNTLQVNQTSSQAIIDWHSFNIAPNEATHFIQPAGGVALNRIDPTQGASQIFGQLTATGRIILINQAGIFFGPGSKVDVAGIIASTSDMTNAHFLAGHYVFDQPSAFHGSIVNQGAIIAADHGLVALLGTGVANDGSIKARMGTVILASGKTFTVDLTGDQLVNFAVNGQADAQGINPNANAPQGSTLPDGVRNTGAIYADAGTVVLSANAAQGVLDHAINMSGIIEAKSVGVQNGEIILSGDDTPNGIVDVSGTLDASGLDSGSTGGKIQITGQNLLVDNSAILNASGDVGGGEILIGGDAHGLGSLTHAKATVIMPEAEILANAITSGNGGKIVAWADNVTRAYGHFSAMGGALSGNGGFIETSAAYLDVAGVKVNTSAPHGTVGTWLLDPDDIAIQEAFLSSNITTSGSNPVIFTATPGTGGSVLTLNDLTTQLGLTNVDVVTADGSITVGNLVSWASGNSLTLQASDSIILNAGFNASTAALTLTANSINVTSAASITVASLTANGAVTFDNGGLTTTGNQIYSSTVTLASDTALTTSAPSSSIQLNGGVAGTGNLTLTGQGGGDTFTLSGSSSLSGSISIVDQQGILLNSSTVNASGLSGVVNLVLTCPSCTSSSIINSGSLIANGSTFATFSGINTVNGPGTGTLTLPSLPSGKSAWNITISSSTSGSIGDPFNYTGFQFGSPAPAPTPPPTSSIVNVMTSANSTYLSNQNSPSQSLAANITGYSIGNDITNGVTNNPNNDPLAQSAQTVSTGGACGKP